MNERIIYEQMRNDNETLKVEREKQKLIEKDKDKKFIEEYNNLIEEQHKSRAVNKSNISLNTKLFVSPNLKVSSWIKIGKDPNNEHYYDNLEQTQLPSKIEKMNRNEKAKMANSFENKNSE